MNRINFALIPLVSVALAAVAVLPACSVNVKKEKNGDEKQVDINTPMGGIHVGKNVDPADVGIQVYPGAHLKEQESNGSSKSANVNISGFGFALRVVALDYQSDDSPAKIVAFYKDQLKQYGSVLECHTSRHLQVNSNMRVKDQDNRSHDLSCEANDANGNNIELKVGTRENQHIVAIEPEAGGSSFSLVFVRTHGKDADI
jgi:hypothetical protein